VEFTIAMREASCMLPFHLPVEFILKRLRFVRLPPNGAADNPPATGDEAQRAWLPEPGGFIRWLCGEAQRSCDNTRMKAKPCSRRRYGSERSRRHNGEIAPPDGCGKEPSP
jgi:hypothetical protein